MPQLWDDSPEEEYRRGIFEIYKDTKHEWRWRLKAKNGKIIAVSEGYNTKKRMCKWSQVCHEPL